MSACVIYRAPTRSCARTRTHAPAHSQAVAGTVSGGACLRQERAGGERPQPEVPGTAPALGCGEDGEGMRGAL